MVLYVVIAIVGILVGMLGGFFIARRTFTNQIKDNPVLNEDSLRMMMAQMGQKPSEVKIQQMLRQMKASQKNEGKK
jgi:uncharacterized protein YneF (UPF0154 family)